MATFRKRNSKWEAQVRIKGHKNVSKSFILKEHAIKWAKDTEIKIERGIYIDYKDLQSLQFKELIKRYLLEISPLKKSYLKEKYNLIKLLKDPIADLSMTALTPFKLNEFRNRRKREISLPTINREISLISSIITKAQELWDIKLIYNPARNIKRFKENKSRDRRLNDIEINRLEKACKESSCIWLYFLFIFALETGMRRGELLKLKVDDIDTTKRMIALADTKNGTNRTVPISSKLLREINVMPVNFNKLLFPLSVSSFRFYWKQALKKANLSNFRFHDLRHEAISRFFEKGLSIPEVALISGHKDVRMLFRYTHLKAEDLISKL